MRRMGGLWKHIKVTYVMMWIGSLALAGLPVFAGYSSKDGILEAAWAAGTTVGYYAFAMGISAALLTAFYSWRLLFLPFPGNQRAPHPVMEHVITNPTVKLAPQNGRGPGRAIV